MYLPTDHPVAPAHSPDPAEAHRQGAQAVSRLQCSTDDGVLLQVEMTDPEPGRPIVLVCHGFTGQRANADMRTIRDSLAETHAVAAFDFRGHGESHGHSTLGGREALDVAAVAATIRERHPGHRLVGIGFSMGGAAVLRSAALFGHFDAVVACSAPAAWRLPLRPAPMLAAVLTRTRLGRRLLATQGIRVSSRWEHSESPIDLASDITPIPAALVHGSADRYFPLAQTEALYRALRAPKSLLVVDGGGHGEKLSEDPSFLGELVDDLLITGVASDGPHVRARHQRGAFVRSLRPKLRPAFA